MRLSEILKEEFINAFSVRLKDHWTDYGDPDEWDDDIERWGFDILYNGEVIGSLDLDNYFGHMTVDFGARTVEISKYSPPDMYSEDDPEPLVIATINSYFNSPTGRKHFEIMSRQQGLGAQLDEIKVTKTLAGKKQMPSRQLAMDKKKKSPNQGKKPVELNKSAKSMKDLSNEILKGEYTNTREFGLD